MNDSAQLGFAALDVAASRAERQALIKQLIPIAEELAVRAGKHGITVANLRHAAARRGLLPETGTGRSLSFLGAVLRCADLVRTDRFRRSTVIASHGNNHRIYVAPGYET